MDLIYFKQLDNLILQELNVKHLDYSTGLLLDGKQFSVIFDGEDYKYKVGDKIYKPNDEQALIKILKKVR